MSDSLQALFIRAVVNSQVRSMEHGKLGKKVDGFPTIIFVRGRQGNVWVTRRDQTTIEAKVKGVIVYEEDYAVEFREENGEFVIYGKSVHPSLPSFPLSSPLFMADASVTGEAGKIVQGDGTGKIDSSWLDLTGLLRIVAVPANASSPGEPGDVAFDATHLYVCVATDTWLQFTGSTF